MYLVSELLRHKNPTVHTISPGATALEAARLMNEHRIGSLVVVDEVEGGRVAGIVTERDILSRIVAAQRDPAATLVSAIMTDRVLTCLPETTLDEVRHVMRQRRIRHLPVVEGGKLIGMISIGDLNSAETQTLAQTIGYLEAYIKG